MRNEILKSSKQESTTYVGKSKISNEFAEYSKIGKESELPVKKNCSSSV